MYHFPNDPDQIEHMRRNVRRILEAEGGPNKWTAHGLGMLRCYPFKDPSIRLNVWSSKVKKQMVSAAHDHPWNLSSWIMNGCVTNFRFTDLTSCFARMSRFDRVGTFKVRRVGCGDNKMPIGPDEEIVHLGRRHGEEYVLGEQYSQRAIEIHETHFTEGAVTVMKKEDVAADPVARVFYPIGEAWGDAVPWSPNPALVSMVCRETLSVWEQWP